MHTIFIISSNIMYIFKGQKFIRKIPAPNKKLINVHCEYRGHNIYCTKWVGHGLDTAKLAKFSLHMCYYCHEYFS
jgi:hypothetical protein